VTEREAQETTLAVWRERALVAEARVRELTEAQGELLDRIARLEEQAA
jgi:hypothetical protein